MSEEAGKPGAGIKRSLPELENCSKLLLEERALKILVTNSNPPWVKEKGNSAEVSVLLNNSGKGLQNAINNKKEKEGGRGDMDNGAT